MSNMLLKEAKIKLALKRGALPWVECDLIIRSGHWNEGSEDSQKRLTHLPEKTPSSLPPRWADYQLREPSGQRQRPQWIQPLVAGDKGTGEVGAASGSGPAVLLLPGQRLRRRVLGPGAVCLHVRGRA